MNKHRYCIFAQFCFVAMLLAVYSCTSEIVDSSSVEVSETNAICISTRTTVSGNVEENNIRTLRVIIFDANNESNMLLNKQYLTSEAAAAIPANTYTYFTKIDTTYQISFLLPKKEIKIVMIANELHPLDGKYTLSNLRGSIIDFYTAYSNAGDMNIQITGKNAKDNIGYIPMYCETGTLIPSDWDKSNNKVINLGLKRLLAKVTLKIKNGVIKDNTFEKDATITINSASIVHIPKYGYLNNQSPYNDDQISTSVQAFKTPITFGKESETKVTDQLTFFIPEYYINEISVTNQRYTYLQINGTYKTTSNEIANTYKIPLGNGVNKLYIGSVSNISQLTQSDLSISNNKWYNVEATVTTQGELEIFQIKVSVENWGPTVDIPGNIDAPVLDITSTNIIMSAPSIRVHFWTNQPNPYIRTEAKHQNMPCETKDILEGLEPNNTYNFHLYSNESPNDMYLPYNGYIDIQLKNQNLYSPPYTITLQAGKLARTITITKP